MGVITIYRGCFERCCSNNKTPPYHSNLRFATLRTRRPFGLSRSPNPGARRCSVRPHTVRRPRLALGDGAATRVGFFGVFKRSLTYKLRRGSARSLFPRLNTELLTTRLQTSWLRYNNTCKLARGSARRLWFAARQSSSAAAGDPASSCRSYSARMEAGSVSGGPPAAPMTE